MAKRALVLGSQVRGLTGVHTDTSRVVAMLLQRGFREPDIDLRQGRSGTREGMLEGFDRLIAGSREGDLAVVYYSGHGAHVENADSTVSGPRRFQCIVPTDIEASTDEDFRGISSWELSIKQAALTARTRNVVVVLDCCHSAQMSRDGAGQAAVARALPHPIRLGLARYFAALRDELRGAIEHLHPLANPDAVRLVACGQTEAAFECTLPDGSRSGVFTDSLLDVLAEVGEASVSWSTVMAAVRQRVLARFPTQRPDVEGPAQRRLFSLVELDGRGHIPALCEGDRVKLLAGRLGGVCPGDVYDIEPLGAAEPRPLARATVTAAAATSAVAEVDLARGPRRPLPAEAVAIPVELAGPRRPVAIVAPDGERERLAAAVAGSGALRPATDEDAEVLLATLRLDGGLLTVEDHLGPLGAPRPYPHGLDAAARTLVDLAVAQGIRELVGSHGVADADVEIELGTVEGGEPRPMPHGGGALALGDRIYVRLRNATAGSGGAKRRLHAHVLNVGLSHRVSLLTSEAPSGIVLDPGAPAYVLAEGVEPGRLQGLELTWPDGLPRDTARLDELYVVISTERTNLQGLETQDAVGRARMGGQSSIAARLAQLADGQTRDAGRRRPANDDFLVRRLSYLLHPRRGPIAGLDFAVDEEPLNQRGARTARSWVRPARPRPRSLERGQDRSAPVAPAEAASRIAIRLGDLVVESNRALGAADIRVDALVCTLPTPGEAPYVVQTMRFPRIADGERLPLDRALLYHGPVREFVDLCLWVSRDTTDSRALGDLLRDKATSPELQDATSALLSAAGLATPWITAVGASAVLARIAYDLLLGVAGKTIGLYRTSFLAGEGFGVGRHPAEALYRAQDFSFSLLIDPIAAGRAG